MHPFFTVHSAVMHRHTTTWRNFRPSGGRRFIQTLGKLCNSQIWPCIREIKRLHRGRVRQRSLDGPRGRASTPLWKKFPARTYAIWSWFLFLTKLYDSQLGEWLWCAKVGHTLHFRMVRPKQWIKKNPGDIPGRPLPMTPPAGERHFCTLTQLQME